MADHTRYQQGVIRRFYQNRDTIAQQRLGELVTEIYLATGKRLERLWRDAAVALAHVGLPQSRIDHLMRIRDPALLAGVMKELERKA